MNIQDLINLKQYKRLNIDGVRMFNYINEEHRIDVFCPYCKKERVFNYEGKIFLHDDSYNKRLTFDIDNKDITSVFIPMLYSCCLDENHKIFFGFIKNETMITKVCQYPSEKDIIANKTDLNKYKNILDKEKYKELVDSQILFSEGFYIGATTNLRRVYEYLIEISHKKASKGVNWDEASYKNSKTKEKIMMLRNHLPQEVVEHKYIYSLLSKGVHELSDDEALELYEPLFIFIKIILDEYIKQKEKEKNLKELQRLNSRISKN